MINCLPFAIASLVASFILFAFSFTRSRTTWHRVGLVVAALSLTIPAALFSCNYLWHTPSQAWFYYFHSLPYIEASSGLGHAMLGIAFASARLRPHWLKTFSLAIPIVVAALLLIVPFWKQLFFKMDYSKLEDKWKDGVCLQTSGTSCVPACGATVVRLLGGNVTERELAREVGTNHRGTEIWYMMRAMPRHGYRMEARVAKSLEDYPAPCILGMKDGGHVVVLMSKSAAGPYIGNPLGSSGRCTWETFRKIYHPDPVYFVIEPTGNQR